MSGAKETVGVSGCDPMARIESSHLELEKSARSVIIHQETEMRYSGITVLNRDLRDLATALNEIADSIEPSDD